MWHWICAVVKAVWQSPTACPHAWIEADKLLIKMDFMDFILGNAGISDSGVGFVHPAISSLPDFPIFYHLGKKKV